MPCTPYPATFPCDLAPPVHIDPYRPTGLPSVTAPADLEITSRVEDELRIDTARPVPEPSPVLLIGLTMAALFVRRRRSRC